MRSSKTYVKYVLHPDWSAVTTDHKLLRDDQQRVCALCRGAPWHCRALVENKGRVCQCSRSKGRVTQKMLWWGLLQNSWPRRRRGWGFLQTITDVSRLQTFVFTWEFSYPDSYFWACNVSAIQEVPRLYWWQCYNAHGKGSVLNLLLTKWIELMESMAKMVNWATVTMVWLSSTYRGRLGREAAELGLWTSGSRFWVREFIIRIPGEAAKGKWGTGGQAALKKNKNENKQKKSIWWYRKDVQQKAHVTKQGAVWWTSKASKQHTRIEKVNIQQRKSIKRYLSTY